jgi:hypothetical protein
VLRGGEEVEVPSGSRRQALCEQGWSESALRYEARSLPLRDTLEHYKS